MRDNHELVGLLLSSPGIDINAKGKWNWTALHWACYKGSLASISQLLATDGLQLNERTITGCTPLMIAVSYGQTKAVRLMAAKAAVSLDVRDEEGRSLEDIANW